MRATSLWILAAVIALIGADTLAGKGNGKPGGGGGDPTPPGVIYLPGGSILPNGSEEASLPGAAESAPSYALHGGQRWFLKAIFDGASNPDGPPSSRIVAVSEDGSTEVDLTPSSSAEWRVSGWGWRFAWAKDDPDTAADEADGFFSYTAVEWFGTGALDAKSYLFRVGLTWSSSGEPSLDGTPQKIVEAGLEGSAADNGLAESRIQQADWAPDGDRVVYWFWASQGNPGTSELRVHTTSSDSDALLTDGGIDPEWAPDGSLVVYTSRRADEWGIWTVDPDAADSDEALLLDGGKNVFDTPRWSPDGAHACYRRTARRSGGIARIALASGDETEVRSGGQPLGWRD